MLVREPGQVGRQYFRQVPLVRDLFGFGCIYPSISTQRLIVNWNMPCGTFLDDTAFHAFVGDAMKLKLSLLVGMVVTVFAASSTASAMIQMNFSNLATGSMPSGSAPWATLVGTQNGANRVDFTFTHNASSAAGQFITRLYLNISPYPGNLALTLVGAPPQYSSHSFSQNGHNDASSAFDFEMQFGTSNAGGGLARLEPGESMSFFITGTGLTESSFLAMSDGTPRQAMIHLQGIPGGQSGKLTPVPEPASLAALGIGAAALLRRRKKTQSA